MSRAVIPAYDEAVRFLYGLQGFGVKLGLTNIRRLLHELGDPHHALPAVHIAGSNGKGSTAALLSSVLIEAGYSTALYTSPHLIDFRERMRIDGRMVPKRFVAAWVGEHRRRIRERKITFFEATTALAFEWFRSRSVDVAVIETGLGGRLDATNVLDPMLSVITSISREHTHILGNDLRSIAREKAGIGKPGIPCVLGSLEPSIERYLRSFLRQQGVPVVADPTLRISRRTDSRGGGVFRVRSDSSSIDRIVSGLQGSHQARNVKTVLHAIHVLRDSYGLDIRDSHIRDGFRSVRKHSGLEARCAEVEGQKGWYADVAHNPEAMHHTVGHMRSIVRGKALTTIFGISSDKDVRAVLKELRPVSKEIIAVAAGNFRSRDIGSILRICEDLSIPARFGGTVAEGLRMVQTDRTSKPVLITGSHFVVGEALASLQRRKYLTIAQ